MNAREWVTRHFDRARDYVLITGASSGIGLEFLKAFAALGCNCIATSNEPAALASACAAIRADQPVEIIEVVADFCSEEDVRNLASSLAGRPIGVLINNAGFGLKGSFVDHDAQRYADLLHVNALAPTMITRAVLPQMLAAGRGLVVHVASINAISPIGYNAVYTATKAYLLYCAYALAYELKGTPLVFQILLPGTTRTPFHERQGAVPSAMFMEPDQVVRRSLSRVDTPISISNRVDRMLFPVVMALPFWARVRLATYILKKRLKLDSHHELSQVHAPTVRPATDGGASGGGMLQVAWKMLSHKPVRLVATWIGLGVLFFLSAAQFGLMVGWCNSCSAIIRHANADVWVMSQQTQAFDYGTPIPLQRVYQTRSTEGVASAEGMTMAWNTWQRADGKRVNVEVVGLDDSCIGGPWSMQQGTTDCVHLPDGVIVDELFLTSLGVDGVGGVAELYGERAIVRGISLNVRTLTASPFIFTSLQSARRFDKRYSADEVTYVVARCAPGYSPEDVRDRLRAELPHVEVLTTREFAIRTMQYWMLETGLGITVVLTAILGLAVSVVVTSQTLFAVTQEHLANYATLIAVGFGRIPLLTIIVLQSLLLGVLGTVIGSGLFALAARASARTPIPLETIPPVFSALVVINLLVCVLSSMLAVRTVLRVDPVAVFHN